MFQQKNIYSLRHGVKKVHLFPFLHLFSHSIAESQQICPHVSWRGSGQLPDQVHGCIPPEEEGKDVGPLRDGGHAQPHLGAQATGPANAQINLKTRPDIPFFCLIRTNRTWFKHNLFYYFVIKFYYSVKKSGQKLLIHLVFI